MSEPVRPELARAWESYFTQRGGIAPDVPAQALPVVILDDNSKGPYPAYRSFFGGLPEPALAANYSYVFAINNDPLDSKSVMVVDEIVFESNAAGPIIVGLTNLTTFNFGSLPMDDAVGEKNPVGVDRPQMSNVKVGGAQSPLVLGGASFPGGAAAYTSGRIPGPFTLQGQGIVFVRHSVIASLMTAYFRGRYYPAP